MRDSKTTQRAPTATQRRPHDRERFSENWHPVLRAFALTLVVVPVAVYLVVPQLMRAYRAIRARR